MAALVAVAINGQAPTAREWRAARMVPTSKTLTARFGSWNEACIAAGLSINGPNVRNDREVCVVENCETIAFKGGQCCRKHMRRMKIYGNAKTESMSRRPNKATLERDIQGRKLCNICKQWLVENDFNRSTRAADNLQTACRICQTSKRYGLTRIHIEDFLVAQNGSCAICCEPLVRWSIDHDHTCCGSQPKSTCGTCTRGLLCRPCNQGIGNLRDDVRILQNAIIYLTRGSGDR